MNRAGILNFWLYDDAEFELSQGRLILRGANGSGKSVTMQSFLPLVLDGDKRPARLDPFGSRDRKIEYYLLGEGDSGISERTGYLYLEFHNPENDKYVTVGIGLKARRGAQSVGFWGFAITDQRRVNRDVFLYHRDLFEQGEGLIPMDRAGLEAAIGDGGEVVREQGAYRTLVNKVLFGFEDEEAYKELLNLLIQLRSPKLSKDHKPSVIYEILNQSLPALSDEDLRSLSEVLEDLDEIGDRLDELKQQRVDLEKLNAVYHQYNELRLYVLSQQVVRMAADAQGAAQTLYHRNEAHETLNHQVAALEERLADLRKSVADATTRMEAIDASQVMEQRRAWETAKQHLQEVERERRGLEERQRQDMALQGRKLEASRAKELEVERAAQEAQASRGKLDVLADETEFTHHVVYAQLWDGSDGRVDAQSWVSLEKDVQSYESQLKSARDLGRQEQRNKEQAETEERRMSEARELRDKRELQVNDCQRALEEVLEQQENNILTWARGLQVLPVADTSWQASIRRLTRYPEVSYGEVQQPIQTALQEAIAGIERERAQAQHQQKLLQAQRDEAKRELAEWQDRRDPEPARSAARVESRKRRLGAGRSVDDGLVGEGGASATGFGGPLYTLCDFHSHVDDKTRAALETVLYQAGLLDAWVSPEAWDDHGQPVNQLATLRHQTAEDEDVWFRPNPLLFGETLANYLKPAPPEDCGLSLQQVDDVLRTVVIANLSSESGADEAESRMFVTTDGRYQIGPVSGVAVIKPQAEWIGVEARRRARLAEIERLQSVIAVLDNQLTEVETRMAGLEERRAAMKEEAGRFPPEQPLRHAGDALHKARLALDGAVEAEQAASDKYKVALQQWRKVQREWLECTRQWSRLKQVSDLDEALEKLHRYEVLSKDLKNAYTAKTKAASDLQGLTDELDSLQGQLKKAEEDVADAVFRERQLQTEIATLDSLLTESGAMELVAQLAALRKTIVDGNRDIDRLNAEKSARMRDLGHSESALDEASRTLTEAKSRLTDGMAELLAEWQLGFVQPLNQTDTTLEELLKGGGVSPNRDGDIDSPANQALIRLSRTVERQWKSRYESRRLEDVQARLNSVFSEVTNSGLREYALEQSFDPSKRRWFVQSLRHGSQPLTPAALLNQIQQMEEEQRALINEKDRELYEQILLHSVGRAIREKIDRAQQWVDEMNRFMSARQTSSGLVLSLAWTPKPARSEDELDTESLVKLLRKGPETLRPDEVDEMRNHFKSRIDWAKDMTGDGTTLRQNITTLLDYRTWFRFTLYYKKGEAARRELTDSRFNVLSGGEKAMAMYIPLFAATDSRYKDSRVTAPRILCLDEAFAGVDEKNMSDMFELLTDMEFDYMMTSQVLWGCYPTVPSLSIYEVYRPDDVDFVTLIPYYWNGTSRQQVLDGDWGSVREVAATTAE